MNFERVPNLVPNGFLELSLILKQFEEWERGWRGTVEDGIFELTFRQNRYGIL